MVFGSLGDVSIFLGFVCSFVTMPVCFLCSRHCLQKGRGLAVPALMVADCGKLPQRVAVGQGRRWRLPGTEGIRMEQTCTGPWERAKENFFFFFLRI